jgi:PPK2 family polyphosphate:nucleotide phosphotransferase
MTAHPLQLPPGPVDLDTIDAAATPGFSGGRREGKAKLAALGPELADLQERLFAEGKATGSRRRLLLVLQGMDTSGKGGTLKHTVGLVDPQGVRITSFKSPTEEERAHDFLWRIRRAVPEPGYLGVFDRSHYEDVLIGRVEGLAEPAEIEERYELINEFERELVADGCVVLKCMLHISKQTQRERLLARLDNPKKHWKYHPGDLAVRARWDDYRAAYEMALERTNTEHAPWYVVPSDRKWFRNLAVGELLLDVLRDLDLRWPIAEFDVAAERARLLAEDDAGAVPRR